MYYIPNQIAGFKIRKVDLLSDIRVKEKSSLLDSLKNEFEKPDSLVIDSIKIQKQNAIRDSMLMQDSVALALYRRDSIFSVKRDSLYRKMQNDWSEGDSTSTRIEDFSEEHNGLGKFYAALSKKEQLGRPVRIAFLGDSFIEGDIIVGDLRTGLQKKFGGRGVGFVPISSNVAQFRPTVKHSFKGWKTYSTLKQKEEKYTLSGTLFEAEERATVTFSTATQYTSTSSISSVKLLYQQNLSSAVLNTVINGKDSSEHIIAATQQIEQIEWADSISEISFAFNNAKGFKALGVVLEDNSGVVVDNYSLRGSSGLHLETLDSALCIQLRKIRPYDLIVLQYGLNVANAETLQYGWYRRRMIAAVQRLKRLFPDADILLLGVSDRSYQEVGEYVTMPAVLALMHEQRKVAQQTQIPFWNMFKAMGGENSMVNYVDNNWASKDYTHLSFRGGREVAKSLLNAIILEKQFYDKVQKGIQ